MPVKLVRGSDMLRWLRRCGEGRRWVVPAKEDRHWLFAERDGPVVFPPDYRNATVGPKGWLLPRSEPILYYRWTGGRVSVTPAQGWRPQVIYGVRPCDLKAIALLDSIMASEPWPETQYLTRRAHTVLVGMACTVASSCCFCTSVGVHPAESYAADLMIYPLQGEEYGVAAFSEVGREWLAQLEGEEADAAFSPAVPALSLPMPTSLEDLPGWLERRFDDPGWQRLAWRCLSCGLCAYLCPTCYCYGISDVDRGGAGRRVRWWDACTLPDFSRMAGGHDPRPTTTERVRQRIMHKLAYHPARQGEILCTGCGRCIEYCPMGIHLPAALRLLGGDGR